MQDTAITNLTRSSLKTLASYRTQYLTNLYKKRRTGATHVVVTMLSDEKRTTKPYALPVRFIPCITLKDEDVRNFNQILKKEMKKRDMHLAGMILSNFVFDNLNMCTKGWFSLQHTVSTNISIAEPLMLVLKLGGIPVFLVTHDILLIPVWRYWFWRYTGILLLRYSIKYIGIS